MNSILFKGLVYIVISLSFVSYGQNEKTIENRVVIKNSAQLKQLSQSENKEALCIIRSLIDLNGDTIELPENITLRFERGSIKNGLLVLNNSRLEGKVKILCDFSGTIRNEDVYTDWFVKGTRTINKVYDSSKRIQAVFDLSSRKVFFGKGYYQFAHVTIGPNVEIIGKGTVIVPIVLEQDEYEFNFLKNVFYSQNAKRLSVKNIMFKSSVSRTILNDFKSDSIYGEPLIWVDTADEVIIDGCVFRDIENCTYCSTAYNYYGKKQGSCVCLWDVDNASYINCEQVNCRHDEQVWIIAVNKMISETRVTYKGNHIHDMTPGPNSSAFTCVAGNCLFEDNLVENYFYPGSMFNVFAKTAVIRNNIITDSYCSSVFDLCEYSFFHNDAITIEDNTVDVVNSALVLGQSKRMVIKNNRFRGLGLYYSANNRIPQQWIGRYPYWYSETEAIIPTDTETDIEGNVCDFTSYDGNRAIAGTKVNYGTGEILEPQEYNNVGANYGCGILIHPNEAKAGCVRIINNKFTSLHSFEGVVDKNNLAGTYPYTIKLMNTESVIISGNVFVGCYPLYESPNEYTCISVYNYPDVMETMEEPVEICQKPSEYGRYIIEDNVFNVPEEIVLYPLSINPRINVFRRTTLVFEELVVRNNRIRRGGGTEDLFEYNGGIIYKQTGPVDIIKEIVE